MIQMELHISVFAKAVGDDKTAECFLEASNARKEAIDCVFWNESMGQWLDYWLINGTSCEVIVEAQTFFPFYTIGLISLSFIIL